VDVLMSTHYMFTSSLFKTHMTIWDELGCYVAAVCHDLGHMGLNNAWYINTAGNLALLYGDESVLENYHIAETFRILNNPESNWMSSFPSSVRRYISTVIRRSILATDLKVHGTKMLQLQSLVDTYKAVTAAVGTKNANVASQPSNSLAEHIAFWRCESVASYASLDKIRADEFRLFRDDELNAKGPRDVIVRDLTEETDVVDAEAKEQSESSGPIEPRVHGLDDERMFLLEVTVHACDVANPCKPLALAKQWADRYLLEAFAQGDRERSIGIPVSAGMDRYTTKLATSQIGFITFIVKRLFQLYAELVDVAEVCVENMLQTEVYWQEEKKKMAAQKQKAKPSQQTQSSLVTIDE